jgi:TldD protein
MAQFLDADQFKKLSDAGLSRSRDLGAGTATIRVGEVRSQMVALRDGALESAADDTDLGVGVSVVVDGFRGFAASVDISVDSVADLATQAVASAKEMARIGVRPIEIAPEPVHANVEWSAPFEIDPTGVPLAQKVALLAAWSEVVGRHKDVSHVTAYVLCVSEETYFANLAGTSAHQRRVRVHPSLDALAISSDGDAETISTVAPPVGRGWEYLLGQGWNFDEELDSLGETLAEKLRSPSVTPGHYDLVIDPSNLWLTIHESIGHATELDRAMGYEAAYAGTSFATPDKLGTLQYGSEHLSITGDRITPYGLATVAIDDEGVAAQSFDLVKDGILVGYQLDRVIAGERGLSRSNGCAYADSALHIAMQRMANVSLSPAQKMGTTTQDLIAGVEDGIFIVGDKSWSIDMQRYNFQFTGQKFFRIKNGVLSGQVRDVAYQATTTDFWGSLVAKGDASTYLLAGAFNCGKGQPGQVAPVSHGCPSVLVKGVNVLNAKAEAGK